MRPRGAARCVSGGYIELANCARTLLHELVLCFPLHFVVGRLGGGEIYAQGDVSEWRGRLRHT